MPPSSPHRTEALWQDLERRILYGLSCEWENAAGHLDTALQRRFRKPVFRLGEMKRRMGQWSPRRSEICLSRDFVLQHPWYAVVEVLRHEMAHQLAETLLKGKNEAPHGACFNRACRMLRADPAATGRYRHLGDTAADHLTQFTQEDRILVRVKKLLALAESGNRHEAEAAMAKAHQLICKYNIDIIRDNREREYRSLFLGTPALRHFREAYHLAALLQDFYFVQGIWVPAYVLDKGKMGRVLEISGTRSNLDIAVYVHDYVNGYIHRNWRRYNRKRGLNRYRLTDYAIGVIEGFREKLTGSLQTRAVPASERALVRAGDRELARYLTLRHPRIRTFHRQAASQDDHIVDQGMDAGRRMVLSKGISTTRRSGRLLPQEGGGN